MTKRHSHIQGFSLIELMVAVAIVGILGAIAYPAYTSQIAKGKRAECRGGLLQSMQQQERYFTQFNSYTPAFAAGAATAKTKSFSGDSLDKSACSIQGIACSAPSNTSLAQCIELRAIPRQTDPKITYIYMDAEGQKGCEIGGARSTTDKDCWPS